MSPRHFNSTMEHTNSNDTTTPPISPRGTTLPPIELPLPMIPIPPPPNHPISHTTGAAILPIVYSPLSQPPTHPTMSPIALYPTPTTSTSNMTIARLKSSRSKSTSGSTTTTADEREQHRRLSHSAIEKRRRERINDKIDQLKHLIPSCCPSSDALPSASMHQPLHKLSVLQAAIDYIHQLHDQLIDEAPALLEKESSDTSELIRIISHVHDQKQKSQQNQQMIEQGVSK